MDENTVGTITLRCDCHCCNLVIDKYHFNYEEGNDYNIAIEDSYLGNDPNSLWGRLKRACGILFGKPIRHAGLYVKESEIIELRDNLSKLIEQ